MNNLDKGTEYELEAPSGLANFDMYFPQENLVVEIDGSTHFYGLTDKLLPKYVTKREVHYRAGVDIIHMNYHDTLNENSEVRMDKVQQVLEKLKEKRAMKPEERGRPAKNIMIELLAEYK